MTNEVASSSSSQSENVENFVSRFCREITLILTFTGEQSDSAK